jgi:branched-chain amino acid transport system ATP-binding protein
LWSAMVRMGEGMSVLTVENLYVSYGTVDVLHDINLSTEGTKVCAVLGPEGSGKTSLVRSVTGQISRRGAIFFDHKLISTMTPREITHLGIAMVPQGLGISVELSVEDNLLLGGYVLADRSHLKKRIADMYGVFPVLREYAGQPADSLSGGGQVFLAVARAMLAAPRLLILDEPSAGLEPPVVQQIFHEIAGYVKQQDSRLLLVEKNLRQTLTVADRVFILADGQIVAAGPPEQFRQATALEEVFNAPNSAEMDLSKPG